MSDYDNAIFRLATAQEAELEDYIGEDGLLYCASCRQPKEAYFPEGKTFFGRDRHPKECECDLGNSNHLNFLIFFASSLCTFTPAFVTSCHFSAKKNDIFHFSLDKPAKMCGRIWC